MAIITQTAAKAMPAFVARLGFLLIGLATISLSRVSAFRVHFVLSVIFGIFGNDPRLSESVASHPARAKGSCGSTR
jgi:hypothetical protein